MRIEDFWNLTQSHPSSRKVKTQEKAGITKRLATRPTGSMVIAGCVEHYDVQSSIAQANSALIYCSYFSVVRCLQREKSCMAEV